MENIRDIIDKLDTVEKTTLSNASIPPNSISESRSIKCKICGVSDAKILNYIINHKFPPQFIGFIVNYPKSKRFVEINKLKNLINIGKKKSKFVAVLVKP